MQCPLPREVSEREAPPSTLPTERAGAPIYIHIRAYKCTCIYLQQKEELRLCESVRSVCVRESV